MPRAVSEISIVNAIEHASSGHTPEAVQLTLAALDQFIGRLTADEREQVAAALRELNSG
jgi:uncharacterized protein (DUF2267 family)